MKSLSLTKPHMIVMVGVPGSGKSFFADKFAETFHAPCMSYEKITAYVQGDVPALCYHFLSELLKTQQSIVVDGGAGTRLERMELAKKAHEAGYEVLFIWVQTDQVTAKGRALHPKTSKYTPEVYEQEVKRFVSPIASEKPLVISGKHTYATQARVVLKKLSSPRAEISAHGSAPLPPRTQTTRRNITVR